MALVLSLVLSLLLVCGSQCAVQQSSPEAGVGGYLADRLILYEYRSVASVHRGTNITLQGKVRGAGLLAPRARWNTSIMTKRQRWLTRPYNTS